MDKKLFGEFMITDSESAIHLLMLLVKMSHEDKTSAMYSAYTCLELLGFDTDYILKCIRLPLDDELKEKIIHVINKSQQAYKEDIEAYTKTVKTEKLGFKIN